MLLLAVYASVSAEGTILKPNVSQKSLRSILAAIKLLNIVTSLSLNKSKPQTHLNTNYVCVIAVIDRVNEFLICYLSNLAIR